MPSVTTMVLTPTLTTSQPFTAPTAVDRTSEASTAAPTLHPWLTWRVVSMMAASPKLEATDMSTNSPTTIVQSRAAVRKTSAAWL